MGEIGEFWRDVKEDRKKRKREEPPPKRRCWDWMIVSGNCHYAKNRSSFKTYRPLGKTIKGSVLASRDLFVAGVGTVELKVRTGSAQGSPDRILVLENVLHIPSAICNGFSLVKYHRENGGSVSFRDFTGSDGNGSPLYYGRPFCGLQKLALAGNPQGESYLKEGEGYALSMHISEEDLETIFG